MRRPSKKQAKNPVPGRQARAVPRGRGVPLLKVGHRPTPTRKGAAKPTTGGGKSYKPGRTAGKPGGATTSAKGGASKASGGRTKKRR